MLYNEVQALDYLIHFVKDYLDDPNLPRYKLVTLYKGKLLAFNSVRFDNYSNVPYFETIDISSKTKRIESNYSKTSNFDLLELVRYNFFKNYSENNTVSLNNSLTTAYNKPNSLLSWAKLFINSISLNIDFLDPYGNTAFNVIDLTSNVKLDFYQFDESYQFEIISLIKVS